MRTLRSLGRDGEQHEEADETAEVKLPGIPHCAYSVPAHAGTAQCDELQTAPRCRLPARAAWPECAEASAVPGAEATSFCLIAQTIINVKRRLTLHAKRFVNRGAEPKGSGGRARSGPSAGAAPESRCFLQHGHGVTASVQQVADTRPSVCLLDGGHHSENTGAVFIRPA